MHQQVNTRDFPVEFKSYLEFSAAYRDTRARCRPTECSGEGWCWVEVGAEACDTAQNRAPRCVACRGKIRPYR
jgi:hypothetical protein